MAHLLTGQMRDVEPMKFRKAVCSIGGSAQTARPSTSSLEQPRTLSTDIERSQAEQKQTSVIIPHHMTTRLRTTSQVEKNCDNSRKRPRSASVKREMLRTENILASEETVAWQGSDSTNPSSKRPRISKQHVNHLGGQAGMSNQIASTSQQQLDLIKSEWKKVHAELHRRDNEIRRLNLWIDKEENSRQWLEARINSLSDQINRLSQEKGDREIKSDNWRKAFLQLKDTNKTLAGKNRVLQIELDDHKESFRQAMSENKALHERIDQQEQNVTKAQNAAMSVLSRSLSATLPDNRIRIRFSELFESIAEWARENAAAPSQAIPHTRTTLSDGKQMAGSDVLRIQTQCSTWTSICKRIQRSTLCSIQP